MFTYYLYINEQVYENFENNCTRPNLDNPFMNATMNDYLNVNESGRIIDRPIACSTEDPVIQDEIETNFNKDLFRDVTDIYGKHNSQRQFYTTTNTTIPNDQTGFANWLYKTNDICKTNTDFCQPYTDPRGSYKRT